MVSAVGLQDDWPNDDSAHRSCTRTVVSVAQVQNIRLSLTVSNWYLRGLTINGIEWPHRLSGLLFKQPEVELSQQLFRVEHRDPHVYRTEDSAVGRDVNSYCDL